MVRYTLIALTVCAASHVTALEAQTFDTIAYWQFEPGADFLKDSSGNGYDLSDPGVAGFAAPTFSADTPLTGATTGSALFDGAASFTQTIKPLELARYERVRFTYWVKVETTTSDLMLFENSFDTNFQVNTGSTFHLLNASGTPAGSALVAYRTGVGFPSSSTTLDVGTYGTLDEWHQIEVDYDFTLLDQDARVTMQVNDVAGTKLRSIVREEEWSRLRDDTLYVGGRKEFAGNPTLLFGGKIAEVKIEGVLAPVVSLAGDFNDDRTVDGADFLAWQRGESPMPGSIADLDDWRQHFGESAPPALEAVATIPEPGSLLLAATCVGGLFRRKHLALKHC